MRAALLLGLLAPVAAHAAVLTTTTGTPLLLGNHLVTPGAATASAAGAASIIGTDLPPDQVYQTTALSGATAQVAVSAAYTGTAGTVQASVAPFGGSGLAPGATWQTIPASGGTASGAISVPRGGPYALAFRDSGSGVGWTSAQRIYVGDTGGIYGQSLALGLLTSNAVDYLHSQSLGRRQAGGGWNVVSNASGETFATVPATVYGGKVNPALGISGEISSTQGDTAGTFVAQTIAATGSPLGIHPYAVPGTAASYWAPGSGTGWGAMMAAFQQAPYAFGPSFAVRWQGQDNTGSAAAVAALASGWAAERDGWWAATGRNAATFRFGLILLGPTGGGTSPGPYGQAGQAGQANAAALSFVGTASNGAYIAANPMDLALNPGDSVHMPEASYMRVARRAAVATPIALGRTVTGSTGAFATGSGPRITSVTRSGNVLTLTVGAMDGSTALVMGDGGTSGASLAGLRVWNGPASGVAVSGAAVGNVVPVSTAISGNTLLVTLPAGTSYPVSIDHQLGDAPYGQPPVAAGIVYGNNIVPGDTLGLPVQPLATVTVP